MRYVWILILLALSLVLCGCRSKKIMSESEVSTNTSYNRYQSLSDTARTLRVIIDKSKLRITERVVVTEYDSMGSVRKRTERNMDITHDSDKVETDEKEEGNHVALNDSLNHIAEANKKVTEEVISEGIKSYVGMFWVSCGFVLFAILIYICKRNQ